jgi:hypothetical protein
MQLPTPLPGFAERIARLIHEDVIGALSIDQRGGNPFAVAWEDLPEFTAVQIGGLTERWKAKGGGR